jgi:hypothetical protein
VLLGDACAPKRDSSRYREMIETLRKVDDCVGWHVCGAYLRNRTRKAGFREEDETPTDVVEPATEANRETLAWVEEQQNGVR